MRVLFISHDPLILTPTSRVRRRMKAYAQAIGSLTILMPGATEEEIEHGYHLAERHIDYFLRIALIDKTDNV